MNRCCDWLLNAALEYRGGRGRTRRMTVRTETTEMQRDTWDVLLQGQPVINATLRIARRPARIRLNHQPVEMSYNESAKTITFSLKQK